jgi:hypothetical protein
MGNLNDLTTSWEGYRKSDVEDLIKEEFRKDKDAISSKIGAVYYDQQTMSHYFFDSEESKSEWLSNGNESLVLAVEPLKFSGTVSQVKIINEMQSTMLYFTTKGDKAEITCSFVSQEKGIADSAWNDVLEDFEVSVFVDKGNTGEFVALKEKEPVLNGNSYTFNIKNSIVTGDNRVRVTVVGVQSGSSSSITYNVKLTTMYISPSNFTWYLPFVEGKRYTLGGVNIGGELDKKLIIQVKKEDKYFREYEIHIGSNIYTSTAYSYSDLEFPSAGSGVYNIEMWLDANGLESDHLSYNIICVSRDEELSARFVSISNEPNQVYNFSENKLFDYCVYNAGQSATGGEGSEDLLNITLDTIINTNKLTLKSEDLVNIPTGRPLEYISSIETEVPEGSLMELSATVTYGNAQQVIYPIDNSKAYPATSDVYFYLNPSQRSNIQSDRERIINAINSKYYTAEWTNMSWTEGVDGWTVDEDNRKCLRIPAYSKVDIAYQPLANIKTPITMEFVYKVKNASDYNDPIIYIGDVLNPQVSYDYNIKMINGYYISPNNSGLSSNLEYSCSEPIFLSKGDSVHFNTTGYGFVAVTETNESGNTYKSLIEITADQVNHNGDSYISDIEYIADKDIWIKICRKTKNISSSKNVLYILRDNSNLPRINENFNGVKITPKNICLHSNNLKDSKVQDFNTVDEEVMDIIITISPNYKTNYGNLAQIYCNGAKVRSFEFSSIQEWSTLNNIVLGNNTADLYLYKMRVYHKGFDKSDAMRNFVNSLPDTASREAMYAYLHKVTDDSYDVDYDTCVKNGYNTMVIEMIDGKDIPSNDKNADIGDLCNLKISIHNLVEGEIDEEMVDLLNGSTDILNQTIEGQGTTAMTYGRWNFRWKLDKTYNKRRITAKKNVASSMHSHKMGATRLFNYLHNECVGSNEANGRVSVLQYPVHGFQKILADDGKNYIYRFIGLYTVGPDKGDKHTFGYDNKQYKSTLMHLEGSDHTPASVGFEYPYYKTQYSAKKDVESMGALDIDNNVVAAWEVGAAGEYETDVESDRQGVQDMLDSEFAPAYNVAYFNSTYIEGVSETIDEINGDIEQWRKKEDAQGRPYSYMEFFVDGEYDLIFYNRQTSTYEYYYNEGTRLNVLSDLGLTSSDVEGMTLSEKTEFIKSKRRERFANQWGQYWHTADSIFQYTFLLLFGATDNFKKNSYPYKFDSVANGGKWRWRQDDLDTIFDIDNQGLASKTYSILVGDKDNDGSIYSGDNSVFWTLVRETQEEEIKKMVHSIFDSMVSHPKSGSGSTMDKLIGCIRYCFWNFAQEYFPQSSYNSDTEWSYEDVWYASSQFNPAVPPLKQALGGHYEAEKDWVMMRLLFCASYFNYGAFTATGYNDATLGRMTYRGAGAHNYEITPAIDFNPTVLVGSSGTYSYRGRANAGEKVTVSIPSTSGDNTNIYVMGLDWLSDVGDLSTLTMSGDASLSIVSKRLQRLKVGDEDPSKIPSDSTVKRIDELDCPSMTSVDARNVSTLTGKVDLSKLSRLKEAYFGGTNLTEVVIPDGSKIEKLELPASITTLKFKDLKFISKKYTEYRLSWTNGVVLMSNNNTSSESVYRYCDYVNIGGQKEIIVDGYFGGNNGLHFYRADKSVISFISASTLGLNRDTQSYGNVIAVPEDAVYCRLCGRIDADLSIKGLLSSITLESLANLATLQIENCPSIDGFDIMKEAYGLDGSQLSNIRIVGFDKNGDATDLSMLANMINDVDKDGNTHVYSGIDAQGNPTDNPVIEGRMSMTTPIYRDDENAIKEAFGQSFIFDADAGYYIKFEDPEVQRICFENWGDGVGVTEEQIESVKSIDNEFTSNTEIETFDEFEKFVNVSSVGADWWTTTTGFYGCSNLKSISLPPSARILNARSFTYTSMLETINGLENITTLGSSSYGGDVFNGSNVKTINLPNLQNMYGNANFKNWTGDEVLSLGSITSLPSTSSNTDGAFYNSTVKKIVLPETLESIGEYAFTNCTQLEEINLPASLKSIGGYFCFYNTPKMNIDVVLPNIESISGGQGMFKNSGIKSFDIRGSKITTIGSTSGNTNGTFYNCTNLTHVYLNEGFENIQEYTFRNCNNLLYLQLPQSIKTLGYEALRGCTSLEIDDLYLPNLESISRNAFHGVKIKKISSLGKLTSLTAAAAEDQLLGDKSSLQEIVLPQTLKTLGLVALYGYTSLRSINLDNLENIEDRALYNCTSLEFEDISLPMLKTLGPRAFHGVKIKKISNLGSITALPTAGSDYMNYGDKSVLEEINIPDTITSIPANSFYNYTALKNVRIPSNLVQLNENGFKGCTSLSFDILELPNLSLLGTNALYNVNIKKISFGNIAVLPSAGTGSENYGNKNILEEVEFSNLLYEIPAYSFYNYKKLNSVDLSTISSLGGKAFANCESITNVDLSNVLTIGDGCFIGCTGLKSIGIPANITAIGIQSFDGCTSLELDELNLPALETLGKYALRGTKIKKFKLENIRNLDLKALGEASCIEEVILSPNLTELKSGIFQGGYNITKIEGLDGITHVYQNAFAECNELSSIHLPNLVKTYSGNYDGAFTSISDSDIIVSIGPNFQEEGGCMFSYCSRSNPTIICLAETPPTLGFNILHASGSTTFNAIYVPSSSVEEYKTATGWVNFASVIQPIETLMILPKDKTVYLPDLNLNTYYNGSPVIPQYSVDSDIAYIENNVLKFINEGSVSVTASYAGESSTVIITYSNPNIEIMEHYSVNSNGIIVSTTGYSVCSNIYVGEAMNITYGTTVGSLGRLVSYNKNLKKISEYSGNNDLTKDITLSSSARFITFNVVGLYMDYAYVKNSDTGEYIWKGKNVE